MQQSCCNSRSYFEKRCRSCVEALTAKQIAARFGIGNPTATVSDLRLRGGYAIYANPTKTGVTRYRLGTPARAVVAAGYRAMAASKAS